MLAKFFLSLFFSNFVLSFCPHTPLPPSLVEVLQSNPTGFQSQIPWGFPVPLPDLLAEETDVVQNLRNSGRTSLVLLFSSLWVVHPVGMGFDFIVVAPLLWSCGSFSFVFERGASFFGGFQHPPVNGYSTASCDFRALSGIECMFFYSTILKQSPL